MSTQEFCIVPLGMASASSSHTHLNGLGPSPLFCCRGSDLPSDHGLGVHHSRSATGLSRCNTAAPLLLSMKEYVSAAVQLLSRSFFCVLASCTDSSGILPVQFLWPRCREPYKFKDFEWKFDPMYNVAAFAST